MINLLYQILQIQSYPKWRIIRNIKNYFKVKNLKKQIKDSIYDKNKFFSTVIDFVTFMDKAKFDLNIKITANYKCNTIFYDINTEKYNYILQYRIDIDNMDFDVRFCYYTEEPNRANVRLAMHKADPSYHLTYDWYLDREKLSSYKFMDQSKENFLLATMDYIYNEIDCIIDIIAKKYIYKRKEKEDEIKQEEV